MYARLMQYACMFTMTARFRLDQSAFFRFNRGKNKNKNSSIFVDGNAVSPFAISRYERKSTYSQSVIENVSSPDASPFRRSQFYSIFSNFITRVQ